MSAIPEPLATINRRFGSRIPLDELRRTVTMKTTLGTMKIKMEPDWAPNHVRNFLKLTATGWYNGTAFHRMVKDFVVQGGIGNTRPGGAAHPADRWVRTLKGEFSGDVKQERGIVSMARGDDPDSASTSFFLMLGPAPHLDGKYTVFGQLIEGADVLGKIAEVPVEEIWTGPEKKMAMHKPFQPVVIEKAWIEAR